MDEIPLIHLKMCKFIQKRALQYLDYVAIQQFHPPKKGEFIAEYFFEFFWSLLSKISPQKKNTASGS
jgi:hypothetical protein